MDRRTRIGVTPDGDDDRRLQDALRLRSAQRVIDLAEPSLPATGTERISKLLAQARHDDHRST